MRASHAGAVVKLGGSVLADKSSVPPRVDEPLLRRVAAELAESAVPPLAVVHGAGAFGHPIVQRTGIDAGLSGPLSLRAMGETQRLLYGLSSSVAKALLDAGPSP